MKKTIIILSNYVETEECKHLTYTHSHASEFVKQGYNVVVLALYPTLPIISLFQKNKNYNIDGVNIKVYKRFSVSGLFSKSKLNINGFLYYLSAKKIIKKTIKENEVILIDAHTIRCQGYAAYLLKKKYPNITTIVTTHGGDLDVELETKNGIERVKKIAAGIDKMVAVSHTYAKKLSNIGVKNIKIIYNGIKLFKINDKKQKENTIITVALLKEKRKNIDLVIRGFSSFSKKHPEYKLKIIGDGPLRKELENLVAELRISNKVSFLGKLSNKDVYEELSKAYCFILPSILEGFGIVYPEAMYCGCVTIGTKGEGIDGFIKNRENGFLIRPDEKSITKILTYISENDCTKLVKQGVLDAKSLTWEKNCKEYLKIK